MAATGLNLITKIAIMIISGIFVGFTGYKLFLILADDRQYEAEKIIDIIGVIAGMLLSVLAFWGAYTENACLCFIALYFVIVIFINSLWELIRCLLKRGKILNF